MYKLVVGSLGRLLVARLLPGSDLIPSIMAFCDSKDIRAGSIVSMVGSLSQATYVYAVPRQGAPCGVTYTSPISVSGPIEIISAQGTIGRDEDGNVVLHIHAGLFDSKQRIHGGHLAQTGNIVAVTVEVFILEAGGVSLIRRHDPDTGFTLFFPALA